MGWRFIHRGGEEQRGNEGKRKGKERKKEREERKEREKEKKGREKEGEKEIGVPTVGTHRTKK